jgi:hypothetical protein
VLVAAGLYLVIALEAAQRARRRAVEAMCAALAGLYVLTLLVPGLRAFFELDAPSVGMLAAALGGTAIATGALYLAGYPDLRQRPPEPAVLPEERNR